MPLKSDLTSAMKEAMRAKKKARLGAIRLMLSEIKRVEVDERISVNDQRVLSILDKMVKQRRDSIPRRPRTLRRLRRPGEPSRRLPRPSRRPPPARVRRRLS